MDKQLEKVIRSQVRKIISRKLAEAANKKSQRLNEIDDTYAPGGRWTREDELEDDQEDAERRRYRSLEGGKKLEDVADALGLTVSGVKRIEFVTLEKLNNPYVFLGITEEHIEKIKDILDEAFFDYLSMLKSSEDPPTDDEINFLIENQSEVMATSAAFNDFYMRQGPSEDETWEELADQVVKDAKSIGRKKADMLGYTASPRDMSRLKSDIARGAVLQIGV
jgi:hypothetical protein